MLISERIKRSNYLFIFIERERERERERAARVLSCSIELVEVIHLKGVLLLLLLLFVYVCAAGWLIPEREREGDGLDGIIFFYYVPYSLLVEYL